MEIRESWSPPSKELARLGEKIEWINKDDFICFHCAQKQGQANREEEEPSMYLSYTEWKSPKRMKAALLIRETNFTFFSGGGGGKVVICSLTKSSSISTSDSLEKALNKYLSTQRSPLCILSHVWLQHWGAQSLGKGSRKHPPHPPSGGGVSKCSCWSKGEI